MSAEQVRTGSRVQLALVLMDEDGHEVEAWGPDDPFELVQGDGTLPDPVERGLEGARVGDELELEVAPEDAFGPYDPECMEAVPRVEFAEGVVLKVGESITISVDHEDGEEPEELEARILDVNEETVYLDVNHPLAGRRVRFQARVLAVQAG